MFTRTLRKMGEHDYARAQSRLAKFMCVGIRHWLHLVENLRELVWIGIATGDWTSAQEALEELDDSGRFAVADEVLPYSQITRNQIRSGTFITCTAT